PFYPVDRGVAQNDALAARVERVLDRPDHLPLRDPLAGSLGPQSERHLERLGEGGWCNDEIRLVAGHGRPVLAHHELDVTAHQVSQALLRFVREKGARTVSRRVARWPRD